MHPPGPDKPQAYEKPVFVPRWPIEEAADIKVSAANFEPVLCDEYLGRHCVLTDEGRDRQFVYLARRCTVYAK